MFPTMRRNNNPRTMETPGSEMWPRVIADNPDIRQITAHVPSNVRLNTNACPVASIRTINQTNSHPINAGPARLRTPTGGKTRWHDGTRRADSDKNSAGTKTPNNSATCVRNRAPKCAEARMPNTVANHARVTSIHAALATRNRNANFRRQLRGTFQN